jgi:hypothetical protein
MAKKVPVPPTTDQTTDVSHVPDTPAQPNIDAIALAQAIVAATEAVNGPRKKTIAQKKPSTPWSAKPGEAKPKLKRLMSHHGHLFNQDNLSPAEITALNRITKPGKYLDGFVEVRLRKDRGLDIDYPVKTAAQKVKLMTEYGVSTMEQLANRIADEADQAKS